MYFEILFTVANHIQGKHFHHIGTTVLCMPSLFVKQTSQLCNAI